MRIFLFSSDFCIADDEKRNKAWNWPLPRVWACDLFTVFTARLARLVTVYTLWSMIRPARPGTIPHTSQLTLQCLGWSPTLLCPRWKFYIKVYQELKLSTFLLTPRTLHTDTYITWSVTGREPALPLRQKSVSRTNYTKLCNNWPRNLGRGSLLAAPSMKQKRNPRPWLMAVMQMTSRFMRTDQLFYVQAQVRRLFWALSVGV